MPNYRTAGVYVEEIATLPPSVAEVSTAVPAFIGVTEKMPAGNSSPVRISNLLEYEELFGKAVNKEYKFDVTRDASGVLSAALVAPGTTQTLSSLYYALRMFYDNGGGTCWIAPIGISDVSSITAYTAAITAIAALDEPTLLVAPNACVDLDVTNYKLLCQAMLASCNKLKDRFAILDAPNEAKGIEDFRKNAGLEGLAYGAAYTPFLNTAMAYQYSEETSVKMKLPVVPSPVYKSKVTTTTIIVPVADTDLELNIDKNLSYVSAESVKIQADPAIDKTFATGTVTTYDKSTGKIVVKVKTIGTTPFATNNLIVDLEVPASGSSTDYVSLASIATSQTDIYQYIKSLVRKMPTIVLPPSSSVAGIYARVDRQSGVWKAPANVSVSSIIGPVRNIGTEEQDGLNVDATGGKSINVIRSFAGRGTLVWGARTLAGNDNEWRYIPVRRLFITIEESVQKATAFAVFEPNDVSTWLKVKAMIESYLFGLWQQGALAGSSPDAAYFVNVGLGKTMNANDVLNGLMIFEVGIAAVRPAEFIILRFSHKLQTA